MLMAKTFVRMLLLAVAGASLGIGFSAQAAEVALARLDCGKEPQPVSVASFSDTFAYPDLKLPLVYSCYLVRHGDRYMLWDTGNALDGAPEATKVSLVDLLSRIKIPVDAIEYVVISHHHLDHTGQAASFPKATLLMGKGDWDLISAAQPHMAWMRSSGAINGDFMGTSANSKR
jgi:glyoxylase-like metal-dependent hydrolase (beta-lactamase superfamily II)